MEIRILSFERAEFLAAPWLDYFNIRKFRKVRKYTTFQELDETYWSVIRLSKYFSNF